MAPTVAVAAGFLVTCGVCNAMAVGTAKLRTNYHVAGTYGDLAKREPSGNPPEEAYLVLRAQTNQLEQMPAFLVGGLSCAAFVDGAAAAALSLAWAILRRRYAAVYRRSVGVPFDKMGLEKYTVPAYFVSNTMLVSAVVQAARFILAAVAES